MSTNTITTTKIPQKYIYFICPLSKDVNQPFLCIWDASKTIEPWGVSHSASSNLKKITQATNIVSRYPRGHRGSLKPGQWAVANQQTPTSGCRLVHLDGMTAAPRWASQRAIGHEGTDVLQHKRPRYRHYRWWFIHLLPALPVLHPRFWGQCVFDVW